MKNKTAKLVILVPGRDGGRPWIDVPVTHENEEWHELGTLMVLAAVDEGLL